MEHGEPAGTEDLPRSSTHSARGEELNVERDPSTMIVEALEKKYGFKVKRKGEWEYRWWALKAHVKHSVGVHTMIPLEVWDDNSIRFDGYVCWLCQARG